MKMVLITLFGFIMTSVSGVANNEGSGCQCPHKHHKTVEGQDLQEESEK